MSHKYFGWLDFELDDSTYEIPDKFIATVGVWEDDEFSEELFTIVHRHSEGFPIYGEVAHQKRTNAQHLVDILNTARGWDDEDIDRYPEEAKDAFRVIVESVQNLLTQGQD